MYGKNILSVASPLTQSAEAVKQLIEFVTGKPCKELPATFALSNAVQLTKSSKGDVFYVTTPKACSCPGFTYRGSCKHMMALRSGASGANVEASRSQAQAYQARQRELRAKAKSGSQPETCIKPAGKWPGGMNGPVNEIQGAA
jgi:hypothetical protein